MMKDEQGRPFIIVREYVKARRFASERVFRSCSSKTIQILLAEEDPDLRH